MKRIFSCTLDDLNSAYYSFWHLMSYKGWDNYNFRINFQLALRQKEYKEDRNIIMTIIIEIVIVK